MPQSILKYQLNFPGLTELELPVSFMDRAEILSVQSQRDNIVLYARVNDPNGKKEKVRIFCAETGVNVLPETKVLPETADDETFWWHLGTCMLFDGTSVIHVFIEE